MIDLYLSKNSRRNKDLLAFFDQHHIEVVCHKVGEIDKAVLLEMMTLSPDCFEFLSPSLLRFKAYDNLVLSEFMDLILCNVGQNLRLPIAISNRHLYPDLNVEEARVLIPRESKKLRYLEQTKCISI